MWNSGIVDIILLRMWLLLFLWNLPRGNPSCNFWEVMRYHVLVWFYVMGEKLGKQHAHMYSEWVILFQTHQKQRSLPLKLISGWDLQGCPGRAALLLFGPYSLWRNLEMFLSRNPFLWKTRERISSRQDSRGYRTVDEANGNTNPVLSRALGELWTAVCILLLTAGSVSRDLRIWKRAWRQRVPGG